jgi:hypothetical protein
MFTRMTGKSKIVLKRTHFIEKSDKAAYKHLNHSLSLLNYESCENTLFLVTTVER